MRTRFQCSPELVEMSELGKKNRGGICIKEMVTDSKGTETVEKEGAQRQNLEEKPH